MAAEDDVEISLRCGDKTFICSKEKLAKESSYFEALFSNSFSDSGSTTHTFSTEVMEPYGLEFLVDFINNGVLRAWSTETFSDLVMFGKAALYLQIKSVEPHLQRRQLYLLSAGRCLSQAQQAYSLLDLFGEEILTKCIWRVPWKLYDLTETEDFMKLSPAELYWLLRNPAIVDPTGGIKGLLAIHRWIDGNYEVEVGSPKKRMKGMPRPEVASYATLKKLCALFIFALVEGLEEKIAQDAPPGYARRAVIKGSSLSNPRRSRFTNPSSTTTSANTSLDAGPEHDDDPQAEKEPGFEGPLPVTQEDLCVIQGWREDDNVFRHLYQTQKKLGWSLCFTGFDKRTKRPLKYSTGSVDNLLEGLAIFSIDTIDGTYQHIADFLDPAFGYRIETHGSEVLVLGGEKRKLGSGLFAPVHRLDFLSKTWITDEGYPLIQQRTFLHCWRADGDLVYLGGYERYRAKAKKVMSVEPSHYDDSTSFVSRDTCLTQTSGHSTDQLYTKFTMHELEKLADDVVSQRGVLASVGGHLLLLVNKTLHIHCPGRDEWATRVSPISGAPDHGFTDAIPYGAGIYFIDTPLGMVYWMLVSPELIDDSSPAGSRSLAPAFHAILYGKFEDAPETVCRVEDKLYSFREDKESVKVQVMDLRYNPFEPLNQLDPLEVSPATASSDPLHSSSGEDENIASAEVKTDMDEKEKEEREYERKGEEKEEKREVIPDILPTLETMYRAAAHRMIDIPFNDEDFKVLSSPDHWRSPLTHAEAAARRAALTFSTTVYPHGEGKTDIPGDTLSCLWCETLTQRPTRSGNNAQITPILSTTAVTLPFSEVPWVSSTKCGEPISLFAVYDPVDIISEQSNPSFCDS